MTYNPSIPQPTDNLSDSQGDILKNFSSANTSFGVNHYPFADGTSNNGKHKFVEMTRSASPPGTLLLQEGVIYLGLKNGETQVYYSPDNSGLAYQLTSTNSTNFTKFATNTGAGGWTFLPGGLLLQYGKINVANTGTATTLTFPRTFLAASVPFSITLGFINNNPTPNSPTANSVFVKQGTETATGCELINSSAGTLPAVYWMAIGLADPS